MDSISDIAREALIYGLPTVDLYRILYDFALDPSSPEFKAPLNDVFHSRRLADPDDRSIVAMNVDTPYSYAWLDLRSEPVVLTMPAFEPQRYVSAQLIDLYTYIVGYISPRTNGHRGGEFLIAGPSWTGDDPPDMRVFRCPTELCLVLIRTQLFDEQDMPNVAALQDAVSVAASLCNPGPRLPGAAPALAPIAPVDVRAAADTRFFDVLDWMLALMPALPEDRDLRDRMARIGLRPGARLDLAASSQSPALAGMRAGMQEILEHAKRVRSSGEIFGSRQLFAGDHLARLRAHSSGTSATPRRNTSGSATKPTRKGVRSTAPAATRSRSHAAACHRWDAFWSITVYDADKHLYANEIDRYVISSRHIARMKPHSTAASPSTSSTRRPHRVRIANWLPCPSGPFGLTFRTDLPGEAIRSGAWSAPPVERKTSRDHEPDDRLADPGGNRHRDQPRSASVELILVKSSSMWARRRTPSSFSC